jgi:amino acid transporter
LPLLTTFSSRDRALFYSTFIGRVHPKLKVPLNAILLTVFTTAVISLTTINTVSTLHTVLGLSTSCFMATYIVSIGCLILKRLNGEQLPYCRWCLGSAGLTVNVLGWLYAVWAFFWSFWPTRYASGREGFNNAVLFFMATVLSAGGLYLACWRKDTRERAAVMARRGKDI